VFDIREVPGCGILSGFGPKATDAPSCPGSDSDSDSDDSDDLDEGEGDDGDDDDDERPRVNCIRLLKVMVPLSFESWSESFCDDDDDDDDELLELEEGESDGTRRLRFRTRFFGAALLGWGRSIAYTGNPNLTIEFFRQGPSRPNIHHSLEPPRTSLERPPY